MTITALTESINSHILWNLNLLYSLHKNPPLVVVLSQIKSIYTIASYLFTVVMELGISGARPPLPYMPSWHVEGLYLFDFIFPYKF
jgi:hypothetical protein